VVYPAKTAVSADDLILQTAQYYIHFVVRGVAAAADDSDTDTDVIDDSDARRYFIRLHKLLTFPSLKQSCEDDVDVLR